MVPVTDDVSFFKHHKHHHKVENTTELSEHKTIGALDCWNMRCQKEVTINRRNIGLSEELGVGCGRATDLSASARIPHLSYPSQMCNKLRDNFGSRS